MLALLAILIADVTMSDPAKSMAICEASSIAIKDLPMINHNNRFDAYYDDADPILSVCPELHSKIPADYPMADSDAHRRANTHAPIFGKNTREAFIYSIGVPQLSDNLKTAIFTMRYDCSGLCGATFMARYERSAGGWHRVGEIILKSVS